MTSAKVEREHGTRAKYVHDQCRCGDCTFANNDYRKTNELARALDMVELVDAASIREHLRRLSAQGVGYKQAALIAGVSKSATFKIYTGSSDRVRPETAQALLQVTTADVADGQYIDASECWANVQRMRDLGYPKSWISLHIGQGGRALQLGKRRVTKRNADAVKHLALLIGDLRYDAGSRTVEDEARSTARLAALLAPRAKSGTPAL